MSSPEIKLRFGGPNWNPAVVEKMQAPKNRIVNNVFEASDHLGVKLGGKKVGKMLRFPRSTELSEQAYATAAGRFVVNVQMNSRDEISRRSESELSSTTLHEVIHCERMRRFRLSNDLYEDAATEGLAYTAEMIYANEVSDVAIDNPLEGARLAIDPRLETMFLNEAAEFRKTGNHYIFKSWTSRYNHNLLSPSTRFGVQCVYEQLEHGANLGDLVHLPAKVVLGVE